MRTFGVLGLSCETQEPKRAKLRAPALQNITKIPREDPQKEGRKNENCGREKKKSEILGRSSGVVRRRGGPAEGGPEGPNHFCFFTRAIMKTRPRR